MPSHPKTVTIENFKGLNNILSPEATPADYLKELVNLLVDKSGNLVARKGLVKKTTGNYTSLWSDNNRCFAVKDGDLLEIYEDNSEVILRSNVGNLHISFENIDNNYYYSSPLVTGIIEGFNSRSWGIEKVHLQPTLSVQAGSLKGGIYQVAVTHVADDGRESGTSSANQITITDGKSIVLSNIPISPDPRITHVNIYCSTQNGDILYLNRQIINGVTSTVITDITSGVLPLKTFNLNAAPNAHLIKYYRGRVYLAVDNFLYYSEPLDYEHFDYRLYFEFPDTIREICPVEDGIWIASDNLYYLSGTSPDVFSKTLKEEVKVVPNTGIKISGSYLHIDNTPVGYKWLISTNLGIFILFNQGLVINSTAQNINLPRSEDGCAVFLQDNGMNHYLSILKDGEENNVAMGDIVTGTIVRNGIIID